MQPSYHEASAVVQPNGPQHVIFIPEGSPNPSTLQYVNSMPAVTTNDNNNKVINVAINSNSTIIKQHPVFFIEPTIAWCDKCEMNANTVTKYYMGCTFWIVFILYLLLMPYCICCPFINKRYWNVRHRCSKCHHKLGIYKAGRC
ncbi:hypothetical protein SteCoe_38965 [Stentor coeruleus]|uniref:LITAF domain-containing protein n=1 Tax=Stentor coeruleus TaxID=5963 RepID=A0A1R2AKW6_9CILI|nr:hypothetical protein SteCoe_38965 [Stentor coeruleus]